MPINGLMWECTKCGHNQTGDEAPEECESCHQLDCFVKLPAKIAEEREKDMFEDFEDEE